MHIQISPAAARVNAEMTQEAAAKRIGVATATLQNWESGKSEPTISQARKLAETYSIPLDTIIFLQKQSN